MDRAQIKMLQGRGHCPMSLQASCPQPGYVPVEQPILEACLIPSFIPLIPFCVRCFLWRVFRVSLLVANMLFRIHTQMSHPLPSGRVFLPEVGLGWQCLTASVASGQRSTIFEYSTGRIVFFLWLLLRFFSSFVFSLQTFIMMPLVIDFFELSVWGLLCLLNLWLYVSFPSLRSFEPWFLQGYFQHHPLFPSRIRWYRVYSLIAVPHEPETLCMFLSVSSCSHWTVSLPISRSTGPFLCPVYSAKEHTPGFLISAQETLETCGFGSRPPPRSQAHRVFGFPVHMKIMLIPTQSLLSVQ